MAAITDFETLKAAILDYEDRDDDGYTARLDAFVSLAEARFNRILKGRRMEASTTVTTDTDGAGALPDDFLVQRLMYRTSAPKSPLKFTTKAALKTLNPYDVAGIPTWAAIDGAFVRVSPLYEGDFTLDYYAKIPALSDENASNWLLALAPDAYLFASLAQGKTYLQDTEGAAMFLGYANSILSELGLMDNQVAYMGTTHVIPGPTP